ncbi:flavin reductase family protein [Ensifer adhaerens]|uniref:flavin reductase family protein n=1 Tax=Ensifer adhaerens TaxID=106592 RepID=UPI001CBDB9AB|nr:flavin reductase family protein [Ensifer adhaerens]MBZ7924248.1 flavin reductase family protein [Ensifer adhaerens]UAX96498.1 flavin reductase family protein [Ensifer adhaerens]UAY04158.1 flavin reductase family protein [Ensifer adhaerens]UAY12144.1 flavin reductase family protein [Ensifer adhaerens]
MHYDATDNNHGLKYDPFKAIVAPRPIGWITTMSAAGEINCAPYSFFNAVSDSPNMVAFSSRGMKDSATFAEETGEFTCSFATFELREQMYLTSMMLPRGGNELEHASLEAAPSNFVKPPRVAAAPAALECKWLSTTPLPSRAGITEYYLVIGEVVGVYIDDRFIQNGLVNTAGMRPIMRAGYDHYFSVGSDQLFRIKRPDDNPMAPVLTRP